MLDDQNTPDFSVPQQAVTPPPGRDVSSTQEATPGGKGNAIWGIPDDSARGLNYLDYYWMMSLADFLAWIQKDGGSAPPISFSKT